MTHTFHKQKLVLLAMLLWLFASGTGMHGHYCYDGIEAPVSLHFDTFNELADQHDLTGHMDLDSKASQASAIKLFNTDLQYLSLVFLLVIIWPVFKRQHFASFNTPAAWLSVFNLRPPLRAPPALIA